MTALVSGSRIMNHNSQMRNTVVGEFQDVIRAANVAQNNRRYHLQVLHSTRALDSFLKEAAVHHKCTGKRTSLGANLINLKTPSISSTSRLTDDEVGHYQTNIVNVRNRYMHQAGTSPVSNSEVDKLLSYMHACLARVAAM